MDRMTKKKRTFNYKEINEWLCSFPIKLTNKKRKWKFDLVPLQKVLKWKNSNRLPNIGRISFNEIADLMEKEYLHGLQKHYIEVLTQEWVPIGKALTIIAIKHETDGIVVYDGTHRLSALARAYKMKLPIQMKYVGVLMPTDTISKGGEK